MIRIRFAGYPFTDTSSMYQHTAFIKHIRRDLAIMCCTHLIPEFEPAQPERRKCGCICKSRVKMKCVHDASEPRANLIHWRLLYKYRCFRRRRGAHGVPRGLDLILGISGCEEGSPDVPPPTFRTRRAVVVTITLLAPQHSDCCFGQPVNGMLGGVAWMGIGDLGK